MLITKEYFFKSLDTKYLLDLKNKTLLNGYEELIFAFDRRLGFEKAVKKPS